MKNLVVVKLFGALLILLIAGSLRAQESGIKTLPPITVTSAGGVSQKVSAAFQSSFKNAVNPTWYKLNRNYLVEFITGDINNKALFQKNGNLIYHIKYGHENNLPKEVRRLVKSYYVDFNIVQAINVLEDNRDIWIVNLEDSKKLIMVRIENETWEEVSNFNKSL